MSLQRPIGGDDDQVAEIKVIGSSSVEGQRPKSRSKRATDAVLRILPLALKLSLPGADQTRPKIVSWAKNNFGSCSPDLSKTTKVGGFEVRCTDPIPIPVGNKKRLVTTWTAFSASPPALLRPLSVSRVRD